MLGQDLVATAPTDVEVYSFSRAALDITDPAAVELSVRDVRPNVMINAAAYTKVDQAESEPAVAFRVNAEAVGALGRVAKEAGSRLVHFSTDYVFDGTSDAPYGEDTPTSPVNVYGSSKLAGELALRQSGVDHLIVRTQWLFGVHGRSFPRTMWERGRAHSITSVVNDQRGRPTYTRHLARTVWALCQREVRGLMNVANAGDATWFDVASRVFATVGASTLLRACTTADFPTRARRPSYSVLCTNRLESHTGLALPHWHDALDEFLQSLRS